MRNKLKQLYLSSRLIILRIFQNRGKSSIPVKIRKILIITPPRIGDVALILKSLKSLKDSYPEQGIHILANDYTKNLVSLVYSKYRIHVLKKGFLETYSLLKKLRGCKFDICIDLNFDYHIKTAVIARLTAEYTIGYDISGRGYLFDMSLPAPDESVHAMNIFKEPLKLVFRDLSDAQKIDISLPEALKQNINNRLINIDVSADGTLILIHPGAHHWTQQWPSEYFAETADRIIENNKVKLVFAGGQNEKGLIDGIISLMKNKPTASFTDLSIQELAGLIDRANLMICNNSGPLHIAVALNTPTISFMGPTIKHRWMPLGDIHRVLRMDDLPCIDCNSGYCKIKTHDCMRLITPSMVLDTIGTWI